MMASADTAALPDRCPAERNVRMKPFPEVMWFAYEISNKGDYYANRNERRRR